jgi:predicted nucleic acid-binding protein
MRAVVDTNILLRALIKPHGTVGPVLRRLRDGAYTLLYADSLRAELIEVLGRPHIRAKCHLQDEDVRTVLALILLRGV